jgi:hypothetical protein
MRLSISLGLAITAAVYGTTSQTSKGRSDVNFPFERAYLCTILFATIGVLFVPFMRIGRQGSKPEPEEDEMIMERPTTGGEYTDGSSGEHDGHSHSEQDHGLGLGFGSSTLTVDTMATTGSQQSYFPRWSWEDERQWKDSQYRESNIVYEVCIKCLEERRVIVTENLDKAGAWHHPPHERRQSRYQSHQLEEVDSGWAQLLDENGRRRLELEHEDSGWNQLSSEQRQSRREFGGEGMIRSQIPERRQPRRQVEKAWKRFPVIPTRPDVDRGDISNGGNGWL